MIAFIMTCVADGTYRSTYGWKLEREFGETPNGNPLGGKWVLRDTLGRFIDCDKYRGDISARNNLNLVGDNL